MRVSVTTLGPAFRLIAATVLCSLWLSALNLSQSVHMPATAAVPRMEIPKGASRDRIAQILYECGLAASKSGAEWGLRLWGHPRAAKAGIYAFPEGTRLVDVLADLEAGRVDLVTVTLPEGLNAKEMGGILETSGVTRADEFAALALSSSSPETWGLPGPTLEGFLFPDTYRFAREVAPRVVADAMIRRFRKVTQAIEPAAQAAGLDLLSWVTLASVVEKETADPVEKNVVAGVLWNRLERGMPLQSDPTVIYGIRAFDGNLRREDLRRDTPYNTYTRAGLPPGPIANPGRASLEAAARPARVPYLYFVSRNDGTHAFSTRYEDHQKAVARYQKGGRP